MSLPERKHPGYTLDDWKDWEGRWELIHGVAYDMTPAPNLAHQTFSSELHVAIGQALQQEARRGSGRGGCRIFSAPTDVFLGGDVVQPDLLVVCDPAKLSDRGIEGAPDLVVEILSPATAQKDLTTKRWRYEAAGVPEYLVVYPDERRAELMRLGPNGLYQTLARAEWGATLRLLGDTLPIQLGEAPHEP